MLNTTTLLDPEDDWAGYRDNIVANQSAEETSPLSAGHSTAAHQPSSHQSAEQILETEGDWTSYADKNVDSQSPATNQFAATAATAQPTTTQAEVTAATQAVPEVQDAPCTIVLQAM